MQHLQGLTIGRHLVYFDVQQQRPPREVQFVPTLVDNKNGRFHVGRQAFDLLQLWLQERSMTAAYPTGRGKVGYASYEDEDLMEASGASPYD